eukprot:5325-Eustigmatos_ZCMA.PRE.1
MDSGDDKDWSDEQQFRRMIRKLRQHTVDLFHHAVHGAKSIRYGVERGTVLCRHKRKRLHLIHT